MAATSNSPPNVQSESKSARKKKSKAEPSARVSSALSDGDAASQTPADAAVNGGEGIYESPYIKELNKNIRNTKKKLNATQKVDSIIAENPELSLDELLSSRKINADQKLQAQKKPSLQAFLAQQEEQIVQYKQFDEEYQKHIATEKAALQTSHQQELEQVRDAAMSEAIAASKKEAKENLLVLSKFLRAAAAKRQGGDETSDENRAFEGALLLIYGGESGAVEAMEKLIAGSDDKVPTVDSEPSEFTYKQVKASAFEHAPYAAEEAWAEEVAQAEPVSPSPEEPSTPVGTDPTVAHAGLTEIEAEIEQPTPNGHASHVETSTVPDASNIDAGAANAAAESNWQAKLSASGESGPDGWIEVARDPAETDTGLAATPAAMTSTQSWAEDVPVEPISPPEANSSPTAVNSGDGFHEVSHRGGRGRGGSQGDYRGSNGRGNRGYRGNRGREGFRGDRGDRGGGEGGYRGRGRGGGYRGYRGREGD
ncbi:hypothetical protein MMC07_001629 [Pseudocyphellaria aurata]|nr:hypothetical protein [Pseudocyphellaria aurata]